MRFRQLLRMGILRRPGGLWLAVALACLGVPASAQTFPFSLQLQEGSQVFIVPNGGSGVLAASAVGQAVQATFTVTYQGSTSATINGAPSLVGSTDFSSSSSPPGVLSHGNSFVVNLQFRPSGVAAESAQLNIAYTESGAAGNIVLNLSGTTPNLTVSYTLPTNQNVVALPNGGTLPFPATGLNTSITATVTITNSGSGAGAINSVSVSPAVFQAVSLNLVPATVLPGNTFVFGIRYTPTAAGTDTGSLVLNLSGAVLTANLTGSGIGPSFAVSYILPTNQNDVPLAAGGTLQFPSTVVNTAITATLVIQNTGTVSSVVNSFSVTGAAFQPVAVPPFPATVAANASLSIGIRYLPAAAGTDAGTLALNLGGTSFTATLSGTGVLSLFSYAVSSPSGDVPFPPNQPLALPDTATGSSSSIVIKVRNTSGAPATIGTISASPAIFSVSNGPPLPTTLPANAAITFNLTFAPTVAGTATGTLVVGSDLISLTGNALGSTLSFTYGSPATTVPAGGTVLAAPTQVGQTSQLSFTITNSGTADTNISLIGVTDTRGVFFLPTPPTLPATVKAGASLTFNIAFAPATTGFASTVLQINTQTLTVTGLGTPPPPLPAIQFSVASGTVLPLQQAVAGVALAAPYSLPLTGVLTLTVNSGAFTPDPGVRFSTGGTTVAFTIPAGSTQAVFGPTGGTQISFQTGSTAGTITLSPTFATQAGLNLTPAPPPTSVLTIAAAAPQLITMQITNVTQAAFSVSVTGLSTTHALSSLTFQFTPTGSGNVSTYTVDVSSAATFWYNSAASQSFGGQFLVTVPFAVPNPSTTALSTSGFKSVSVTATNGQGTSNSLSLSVQ